MDYLFSPPGEAAIQCCIGAEPLIALDYDGTLSPIAPRPDLAATPPNVLAALRQLDRLAAVAILSGRSVSDVAEKLAFSPHYLVGNHGGEGLPQQAHSHAGHAAVCAQWLRQLQADPPLDAGHPGMLLEDKGLSLSLHYRACSDRPGAVRAIEARVAALEPAPRIVGGLCVVNLLPPGAADKRVALEQLVALSGCGCVLYAGDDETDEAVFHDAPGQWLTVRVGYSPASAARYFVHTQPEMETLLNRLVWMLQAARAGSAAKVR